MKHTKLAKLVFLLGACLAFNSQAQSFGDFLKSAAKEVARNAVTNNLNQAVSPAPGKQEAGQADGAGTADPLAALKTAALPAGCKRQNGAKLVLGARPETFQPAILWPENAACPVYGFSDLKFDQALAAKNAFREASKVRCNDCEGGYSFDAWGGRSLIKTGDYSVEFPKLLGGLEPGKSVGWKGSKYNVTITATGAHPLGETPCKQLHYVLTEGGKTVAEYDGMYCHYISGYASKPSWNEVI